MAYEGPQPFKFTLVSGAAVNQYRFLTVDANGKAVHATGATDVKVGVSQMEVSAADKPVEIAGMPAITKITMGASGAIGAKVVPGTAGKAVVATGEYWGWILEAASADGDIVTMVFQPGAA